MSSELKEHFSHYVALVIWLIAGFSVFLLTSFSLPLQLATTIIISSGYVFWGLLHHYYLKDLTPAIMIEYLLYGALFVIIVGTTLLHT